jgi:ABC-type ATPase with predicted acetyltransferase domain
MQMADIIPFKKPSLKEKHRGNSLCKNNHHKWILLKDSHFDSKQGRLVTSWRCERCGKIKTKGL